MIPKAIQVENISKRYKIGLARHRHDTLRDHLADSLGSFLRRNGKGVREDDTFWALKDVSFDVSYGDIVGIIGHNGAGKSTLLKVLSRITAPTEGRATINGRVGSLLEVGTGFHPELTGRENIYLNGSILGMKKAEIDRKFDEIVAFSEIEQFIDTPVKRYSSGMYVRLAFAVAAHLEPEVLIVDEVLAVGDAAFQKKCLGTMEGIAKQGRTILFVSHNMAAVEHLCNKVFLFQDGRMTFSGTPNMAIDHYMSGISAGSRRERSHIIDLTGARRPSSEYRPLLQRLDFFTNERKPLTGGVKIGETLTVRVCFQLEYPTPHWEVMLGFDNNLGQRVFTASSHFQPDTPEEPRVGDQALVCDIPSLTLLPGEYRVKVHVAIGGRTIDIIDDAARVNVIHGDFYGTGKVPVNGFFVLPQRWYFEDSEFAQ